MTKSKEFVEHIKTKLDDVTGREQVLIRALGEALSVADRKLLDDVRCLTIEHETRRSMILMELQTLASRLGTFPATTSAFDAIDHDTPDRPYEPDDEELEEVVDQPEVAENSPGGDWRKALENIRTGAGLPVHVVSKAG